MKRVMITIAMIGSFYNMLLAQTGINTTSPNARLHIEPSNKVAPSGTDGIIVPRVLNLPASGIEKGHLIYLTQHPTDSEGFYYWDGIKWVWLLNSYERTIDKATYVASGSDYTGTGNSRTVNFSRVDAFDPTGFSVAGNQLTVGKSGIYLLSFTSSIKRSSGTGTLQQANFTYQVFKNGLALTSPNASVMVSTANEIPSAVSAAMSVIVELQSGDVLEVRVTKSTETPNPFQGYGINALSLVFMNDID